MNPTNITEVTDQLLIQAIANLGGTAPPPPRPSNPDARRLQLLQALVDRLLQVQLLDADLTAIAALATTSYGRSLLTLVDAAAGRTVLGAPAATDLANYQPLDADLTAIAALATQAFGRSLLTGADAAAVRTLLGLNALALLATVGTAQIDNNAVTLAKLQQLSTDTLLGRSSAGAGNVESVTCTAVGRSLLAAATLAAARTAISAAATTDVSDHAALVETHGVPSGRRILSSWTANSEHIQRAANTSASAIGTALTLGNFRDTGVSFGSAFTVTPAVVIAGTSGYPVCAHSVTTTGFTARQWDNLGTGSQSFTFSFMAIGR